MIDYKERAQQAKERILAKEQRIIVLNKFLGTSTRSKQIQDESEILMLEGQIEGLQKTVKHYELMAKQQKKEAKKKGELRKLQDNRVALEKAFERATPMTDIKKTRG